MQNVKATLIIVALSAASSFFSKDLAASTVKAASPERVSFLVTFGDEKCREPVGDEIVVCAKAPEGDRYRIPVSADYDR